MSDDLISADLREGIDQAAREFVTSSYGGTLLGEAHQELATVRAQPTSSDLKSWIVYLDHGEHLDDQSHSAKFLVAGGHRDKRRYKILRMEFVGHGAEPHWDLVVALDPD